MATNKTTATTADVSKFIDSYADTEQKKSDSFQLIAHMKDWSGFEPRMWGPAIIGFGSYHYKYESGHEGDAPIIGFSPRKAALSLYVYSPVDGQPKLLEQLGRFKMGKSCIYVKKLADIDLSVLEQMCRATIAYINAHHECASRG